MRTVSAVLSWVQSFGIGGAFFLLALATISVSGLALWVVLTALKRGPRP